MTDTCPDHVIELRHAVTSVATVYASCVCGWAGPRHVLQWHSPEVARYSAGHDGTEHLDQPRRLTP